MELKFRLLEHPFYQAWTKGKITVEQLSQYAASYKEFISNMPKYWSKVKNDLNVNGDKIDGVIKEESRHISLWDEWSANLPSCGSYPRMNDLISGMERLKGSALLGAVHAFELQQPEVAKTKKEGLLEFYGFKQSDLTYFDEHEKEEEHIELGKFIAGNFGRKDEFENGFEIGSELIYKGLNVFVSEC